ncbi:hypothetical protein CI102_11500 [Trichoderma harzianum]|nr:hypothetical protein CI102_11500 [Trichoderma harzianum]
MQESRSLTLYIFVAVSCCLNGPRLLPVFTITSTEYHYRILHIKQFVVCTCRDCGWDYSAYGGGAAMHVFGVLHGESERQPDASLVSV